MSKKIASLFFVMIVFGISCEDQFDLKNNDAPVRDVPQPGSEINSPAVGLMATCGGSYSGSYGVISSYYTYPLRTVDVSCAASGATVSVSVTALDVPNRFTIRDAGNNYIAGTGWLGNAAYPGPWGSSLSNSGSASFSFTKSAGTYYLQVETLTPPNYSYTPNTDYWSANISCTCAPPVCTPACGPGYTCVNGVCVCSIACGGSSSGTYGVISSYYTYPLKSFNVTCAASGATITVSCTALDVPNRFTVRDAGNNYITGSGWLGNAAYPGPWGSSLSNSGSATLSFAKSAGTNTYYLQVETLTPPNYSYSPNTDYWSAYASCP